MSNEEQESQPELLAEEWGARLATARESLSISTEQAAADLNLPHDYICKLEQGVLEGLPSMVFAKGYIRAYAKLLKLDDNKLVEEYESLHGEGGGKGQIRPVSRVRQQVKINDPVMKLASWVFILGIVGVSVWWWQTQYGGTFTLPAFTNEENKTVEVEETLTAVDVADGPAQLVLPKLDDAPVEEGVVAGDAGIEVKESSEPSGTQTEQPTVQTEPEAEPEYLSESEIKKLQQQIETQSVPNDEVEKVTETISVAASPASQPESLPLASISAEFVAECWVSIKDADGKTLFNNLRGKGQSVNVTGKPPLNVLIGATSAVGRFAFNGSELDLSEHSRKNIVRINLPLAE